MLATSSQRNCSFQSLLTVLLILWLLQAAGCAGPGRSASPAGSATIESITADYDAGRFQQAYTDAVTLSRRGDLATRDQASYLAGVSAYRMQQYASADRYLSPLVHSRDPEVAGRAAGTLGLADMERANFRDAATHFKQAADRLRGQEKAEAAYRAGLAYREANLAGQARVQFLIARGASNDAAFQAKVDRELRSNGFTLQLGVFAGRSNAETAVDSFSRTPAAGQLGPASIMTGKGDRGETLYYVHVGIFNSFSAALRARDSINQPAIVRTMESLGE